MCQTIHALPDYKIYSHNQPQKLHNKKPSAYFQNTDILAEEPAWQGCLCSWREGIHFCCWYSFRESKIWHPRQIWCFVPIWPRHIGVSLRHIYSLSAYKNITFSFIPPGVLSCLNRLKMIKLDVSVGLRAFSTELEEGRSARWDACTTFHEGTSGPLSGK